MNFNKTLIVAALCVFSIIENSSAQNRISGGSVVLDRKTVPYQASLRYKNQHVCGGTLISTDTILTAAHCNIIATDGTTADPKDLTVWLGTLKLDDATSSSKFDVKEVKNNRLDLDNLHKDISLWKLATPVTFSDTINKIELAETTQTTGTCTLAGWGASSLTANLSNNLKKATLPIVEYSSCKKKFLPIEIEDSICAGQTNAAACVGDAGGALICDGKVAGISYMMECGVESQGYPGVYADVAKYKDWIAGGSASSIYSQIQIVSLLGAIITYLLVLH